MENELKRKLILASAMLTFNIAIGALLAAIEKIIYILKKIEKHLIKEILMDPLQSKWEVKAFATLFEDWRILVCFIMIDNDYFFNY